MGSRLWLAPDTKMFPREGDAMLVAFSANAEAATSVPCYNPAMSGGCRRAATPRSPWAAPISVRNCPDWRCPMPEAAYTLDMMEAVAIFHEVEAFQAAIDE